MTVAAILKHKGFDVASVRPTTKVADVARLLSSRRIGAVVVQDGADQLLGIVSERDIVRRLHEDEAVLDGAVSAIMTSDVETCAPSTTVDDLRVVMTERRIRHVPVVTDGRLTGIISIGDVVKSSLDQLQFERDQLDSYVHQT